MKAHNISEALLRRWRDQMVEAGTERYEQGQDRSLAAEQRRRIRELERALGRKTYGLEIGELTDVDVRASSGSPAPTSSGTWSCAAARKKVLPWSSRPR